LIKGIQAKAAISSYPLFFASSKSAIAFKMCNVRKITKDTKKIKEPKIYASVAGHEAIVPMVALGCGVALLPDVVIKHSPVANQVSYLNLKKPIEPFELGICVQKKRLQEPIIKAFWELFAC